MSNTTRRRDRENAIYSALLGLIANGADPAALTVQQIAEAADIGKGTVYEYFPSKDAILRGLTRHCIESELDRVEASAAACRTLEQLVDSIQLYLTDLVHDRAGIYRVLAGALGVPSASSSAAFCVDASCAERLRAMLHDLLSRLRAAGEIDPALPEEYCFYALSAACVSCIVLLMAAGIPGNVPAMPPPVVMQSTRALVWRALCPPQ